MMMAGYTIVDKHIVRFNDHGFDFDDQVQPNGVDLRVKTIYEVQGKATIYRDKKADAKFSVRTALLKDGFWELSSRNLRLYYVDFFESITVPDGYCGIIHTRSSLVRSGVDFMAGLYDTGFSGQLGGTLRVHSDITIEYGAKLAQLTLHKAEFRGQRYVGRYQGSTSQTAITT